MSTFLEFYISLLKFVNFKLFIDLGLDYSGTKGLKDFEIGKDVYIDVK
jgi:Pescadillo N-terminus